MTIKGVDTTDHTLTGATLKANGYAFVSRYYSNHVNGNWKDIRPEEVAEKTAAGVRIVSNWELMADPPNDRATGKAHANDFLAEHHDLPGHVDWNPCYYSLDTRSSTGGHWDDYARGWADVMTPERLGAYAEGAVLKHLYDLGLITYTWKSMSTSFPDATGFPLTALQTGSGHVAGHSVDFNTAFTANYGGWLAGEEDPNMALTQADADLVVATLVKDPNFTALIWRVHGMTNLLDTVAGGASKGETIDLSTAIKKLPTTAAPAAPADLAAIAKAVNDAAAARLAS